MNGQLVIYLSLLAFVGVAAVHDMLSRRIPNKLIIIGLTASVAMQSFIGEGAGAQTACLGMAAGFALLLPFYAVRGMAAGDVKMMMVVGAFAGPALTLHIVLATFIFGGIGAVAIVLYKRKLHEAGMNMRIILMSHLLRTEQIGTTSATSKGATAFPSVGRMPYGPAIALATVTVILLQ